MKFDAIHPARDRYSFTDADAIVNFAIANGMAVRGHTLVWHNALPNWLTDGNFTRDELETILRDHIMTVVGHFRGRVFAWDVINEALGDDGSIRNTFWVKGIGNDIIDLAFRWAHEADPQARLFYNERTLVWLGPKPEGVYNFVQGLQKRNIPIDGIGLQLHIDLDVPPPTSNVLANMNRLSTLGLEIHLTETDVRMILPAVPSSLDRQSLVYQEMLSACLSIQNCKAFVLWGFTDKYSAIPREYSGRGAALIFDEMYKPKPAYTALNKLLNRH